MPGIPAAVSAQPERKPTGEAAIYVSFDQASPEIFAIGHTFDLPFDAQGFSEIVAEALAGRLLQRRAATQRSRNQQGQCCKRKPPRRQDKLVNRAQMDPVNQSVYNAIATFARDGRRPLVKAS
jgi:hypothetical protein